MDTCIDRRTFVKAAGLAAGALAAAGAPRVLADDKGGKMKKAIGIGMVGEKKLPLGDRMKLVREVGFDGIELNSGIGNRDELKKAIDDAGLGVSEIIDSVHWNKPFSHASEKVREEGAAGLKIALEECKFFNTTSVLLVPGVVSKQIGYDECYTRSQAEIKKFIPMAKELGVKIGIENVWNGFLLSPLEMARYIDEFESEWVGSHFDIGNVANFGFPEQWARILGKRIVKLHIKEFNVDEATKKGKWAGFNWKLGDPGGIDWPAVVKALADAGYTGWATAEFSGGDRDAMKDAADRMDKVLQLK
ncbi:MAG TPA: sugar phosphate isomerase/epimerase family protein [Planctomycetota bacterium]|nr:sugar phosphate isomerase/epimerase family protein [Planctomycetota bacterium]